jgi:hypothetical protein
LAERSFKRPYNEQQVIGKIYSSQKSSSIKRGHPMPDYTLEEFIEWVCNQPNFKKLFKDWKESGQKTLLVPSADRLDDSKPYTLDNIRLITWAENLAKHHKGINVLISKYTLDGKFVKTYNSVLEAAIDTNGFCQCIGKAARNKSRFAYDHLWFRGKDVSEEAIKEKIRLYKLGLQDRSVLQYTTRGEFVKRFDSVKVASEELGLFAANISRSALKNGHTVGKIERYIFIYEDMFTEESLKEKVSISITRNVVGIINDKRYIFDNVNSAYIIANKISNVETTKREIYMALKNPENKEWFYLTDINNKQFKG